MLRKKWNEYNKKYMKSSSLIAVESNNDKRFTRLEIVILFNSHWPANMCGGTCHPHLWSQHITWSRFLTFGFSNFWSSGIAAEDLLDIFFCRFVSHARIISWEAHLGVYRWFSIVIIRGVVEQFLRRQSANFGWWLHLVCTMRCQFYCFRFRRMRVVPFCPF